MAGKFSVWSADKLLSKAFRGVDFTFGATMYLALFKTTTDTPLRNNLAASAQEVAGGGYTRLEVGTVSGTTFSAPASGSITLSGELAWAQATAAWGTVTSAALMDAATGGNVILYGFIVTPRVIDVGDRAKVPAGMFSISL